MESDLKKEDELKHEDNLKNEEDLKHEDDIKNQDDLKTWPSPTHFLPLRSGWAPAQSQIVVFVIVLIFRALLRIIDFHCKDG